MAHKAIALITLIAFGMSTLALGVLIGERASVGWIFDALIPEGSEVISSVVIGVVTGLITGAWVTVISVRYFFLAEYREKATLVLMRATRTITYIGAESAELGFVMDRDERRALTDELVSYRVLLGNRGFAEAQNTLQKVISGYQMRVAHSIRHTSQASIDRFTAWRQQALMEIEKIDMPTVAYLPIPMKWICKRD